MSDPGGQRGGFGVRVVPLAGVELSGFTQTGHHLLRPGPLLGDLGGLLRRLGTGLLQQAGGHFLRLGAELLGVGHGLVQLALRRQPALQRDAVGNRAHPLDVVVSLSPQRRELLFGGCHPLLMAALMFGARFSNSTRVSLRRSSTRDCSAPST
jgi:hypothetical protein